MSAAQRVRRGFHRLALMFLQLTFLRPVERFLAQWISISTAPSTFARERIRLGDSLNFFNAANFFVYAIFGAVLAETATLHLLRIGDLSEPYYWLFILLTSIPFVLICFLLIRIAAPLSFKDVLHISLYPIGAGIFTGAIFALVAAAVVGLLVAVGFIPDIRYDPAQLEEHAFLQAGYDCLRENGGLFYSIVATGLQDAYTHLKPPIDSLSYLRPVIALLYLVIAAGMFMAVVNHRRPLVFVLVLLAALISTAGTA
jgi:hypothetical protein